MKTFIKYSKQIGSDFTLCQGPGGNTSYKVGDYIYLKKSGHSLSNVNKESVFKKVVYRDILNFYKETKNTENRFDNELSIEAPLHVLLNQRYIFHYHSISSILLSAIHDNSKLNRILAENDILAVEYMRPGNKLAQHIKNLDINSKSNIFFLHNHGMIISGNNIQNLVKKIYKVEKLINNLLPDVDLNRIIHTVSTVDLTGVKINNPFPSIDYAKYADKYLFPDHAVFFPDFFSKKTNIENTILFDEDFIFLNKKLNHVQKLYLQTILTIYGGLGESKIKNFIKPSSGQKLRKSKDEIIRLKNNK
jgi:ribulose-5-phosphate 4-epimerase/fuculose-1-phosphate aldolase